MRSTPSVLSVGCFINLLFSLCDKYQFLVLSSRTPNIGQNIECERISPPVLVKNSTPHIKINRIFVLTFNFPFKVYWIKPIGN